MPTSSTSNDGRRQPTGASDGFTLIEALCALAILALGLVAIFQALGGATRGTLRLSEGMSERIVLKSLMAGAKLMSHPPDPPQTGKYGAYDWTVSASPAAGDLSVGGPHSPWRLYRVVYSVRGPGGSLSLDRLKLMAAR